MTVKEAVSLASITIRSLIISHSISGSAGMWQPYPRKKSFSVTDNLGRGIEFSGKELSFSALPYTPHELENAMHSYELPPVYYTVVRVALQQMGVAGDDSWGCQNT